VSAKKNPELGDDLPRRPPVRGWTSPPPSLTTRKGTAPENSRRLVASAMGANGEVSRIDCPNSPTWLSWWEQKRSCPTRISQTCTTSQKIVLFGQRSPCPNLRGSASACPWVRPQRYDFSSMAAFGSASGAGRQRPTNTYGTLVGTSCGGAAPPPAGRNNVTNPDTWQLHHPVLRTPSQRPN